MGRRVFLSYAHGSRAHMAVVWDFWVFLRGHGVDARLDRAAEGQRQDWALWIANEVREAEVVLCLASTEYRERAEGRSGPDAGRWVQWETRLIRDQFHAAQDDLQRFVPVVLPGQTREGVPDFLAPATSTVYEVTEFTVRGAEKLLRFLLGRPEVVAPDLGDEPELPTASPVIRGWRSIPGTSVISDEGSVHGTVEADEVEGTAIAVDSGLNNAKIKGTMRVGRVAPGGEVIGVRLGSEG